MEFENKEISMDDPSVFVQIKELALDRLSEATMHGIAHATNSSNWVFRIVWIIVTAGFTSYLIVQLNLGVTTFLSYPVAINIQQIQADPNLFPAVTICNINPFNEEYAFPYLKSKVAATRCFDSTPKLTGTQFQECFDNFTSYDVSGMTTSEIMNTFLDQMKRIVANDNSLSNEARQNLGYWLDYDMLVSCYFNGEACSYNLGQFNIYWDNNYGNCFTFNPSTDANTTFRSTSTGEGDGNGLQIELVVTPQFGGTQLAQGTGIYVSVQNQSYLSFTAPAGVQLQPGYQTYVNVQRVFTSKLSSPYSNCIYDTDMFNSSNSTSYRTYLGELFTSINVTYYDQEFCFEMCYQDKLVDTCSCSDLNTPPIRNTSYCMTNSELVCLKSFIASFTVKDLNQYCGGACVQKCETIDYKIDTTSVAAYPTLSYLQTLQLSPATTSLFPQSATTTQLIDFARSSLIKIIVNYDNTYYTQVTEVPSFPIDVLLGSVGGNVGLFIGFSAMSVGEFIAFLMSALAICITSRVKIQTKVKPILLENEQVKS